MSRAGCLVSTADQPSNQICSRGAGARKAFAPATRLLWFCVALSAIGSTLSVAADWPTYRGDNARRGVASDALAFPLNAQWVNTAPAPPHTAWAGPDNKVIEGKQLRHRDRHDDCFH